MRHWRVSMAPLLWVRDSSKRGTELFNSLPPLAAFFPDMILCIHMYKCEKGSSPCNFFSSFKRRKENHLCAWLFPFFFSKLIFWLLGATFCTLCSTGCVPFSHYTAWIPKANESNRKNSWKIEMNSQPLYYNSSTNSICIPDWRQACVLPSNRASEPWFRRGRANKLMVMMIWVNEANVLHERQRCCHCPPSHKET